MAEPNTDWQSAVRSIFPEPSTWAVNLTSLDLSQIKLVGLPGIEVLHALEHLNLSLNRFKNLPAELAELPRLSTLNASKNFLRPTAESLRVAGLKRLPDFRVLDIRFNEKCGKQDLVDMLATELPQVTVHITRWGQFVGASASDRDATLLRSQLEPWPTPVLRRRLREDFGEECDNLEDLARADVMERLLACYAREDERKIVRVDGIPVREDLLESLLVELRQWSARYNTRQERPSISARTYMILRAPTDLTQSGVSRKAKRAAGKIEQNARLWDLAACAMREVDSEFAARYDALAVTFGFTGSPLLHWHIDKQNVRPFYGLALGDFPEGQGGICVECDARLVAHVNTRNRLGKVDGRFPHWVAPYDPQSERYSLIYYETEGEWISPTTAIFGPTLKE